MTDNNNKPTFRQLICQSKNTIVKECFSTMDRDSRRRPETVSILQVWRPKSVLSSLNPHFFDYHDSPWQISTDLTVVSLVLCLQVATQFKSSLLKLTEILVAKEAWYIRCLKSNESKHPGTRSDRPERLCRCREYDCVNGLLSHAGRFDDVLIRHQVKYLGLMEHLRVRRAGFAYRRKFEVFLKRCEGHQNLNLLLLGLFFLNLQSYRLFGAPYRYKPLCPATWPHWTGVPAVGVEVLVQHLGYLPNEYKMGRWGHGCSHAANTLDPEYTAVFAFQQHQNIHPSPQDAVRNRGCIREMQTRARWVWVHVIDSYTSNDWSRWFESAATRLQAKYKGYRAHGNFKKQKEAGKCYKTPALSRRFLPSLHPLEGHKFSFSIFSHKDWILLARSASEEGEREESLGCQSHQTVRKAMLGTLQFITTLLSAFP